MLSFKEFLAEAATSKYQERENAKISNLPARSLSNRWDIVATTHARSRAVERQSKRHPDDWEELHRRVTNHLEWKDTHPVDHEGVYFSKSLNHGYAISVDRKRKKIHIINVLDDGKHRATHAGDREVIMESMIIESVEYDVYYID